MVSPLDGSKSVMTTLFKERRSLVGLDLYAPSGVNGGRQVEWHAGHLMVRLAEAEPDKDELQKGRKRLDNVFKAVKDTHMLMWPGAVIPLRDPICSRHRSADAAKAASLHVSLCFKSSV